MEVGRGGRSLMRVILVVNLVVYLIVLGLAAWSLDKYIDGEQDHPHLGGNPSTSFMLIFALTAAIGECSVLIGFTHIRAWRSDSLATASSSAIISWAITALAFGLVCKEIIMGGHRGKRLQTLEALVTISAVSQLMYVLLLHAGMLSTRFGPTYGLPS